MKTRYRVYLPALILIFIINVSLVLFPVIPEESTEHPLIKKNISKTETNPNTVIAYPAVPGFEASNEYELSVNGKIIPVFKTRSVAIAQFAFTGKANLTIVFSKRESVPAGYIISPRRVEWKENVSDNTLSLCLTTPRRLFLHYGGKKGLEG